MLLGVLLAVAAKEFPAAVRALGGERDGIEFVVAHDDLRAFAVDHAFHDVEDAELLMATVDEVAYVDGLPLRMPVGTGPVILLIAQSSEQIRQMRRAAVNIADDVVAPHPDILASG